MQTFSGSSGGGLVYGPKRLSKTVPVIVTKFNTEPSDGKFVDLLYGRSHIPMSACYVPSPDESIESIANQLGNFRFYRKGGGKGQIDKSKIGKGIDLWQTQIAAWKHNNSSTWTEWQAWRENNLDKEGVEFFLSY